MQIQPPRTTNEHAEAIATEAQALLARVRELYEQAAESAAGGPDRELRLNFYVAAGRIRDEHAAAVSLVAQSRG